MQSDRSEREQLSTFCSSGSLWKRCAGLAPLCWRNKIFPSAETFASFAFQWKQQIGPLVWSRAFYRNQQQSRPFSSPQLIRSQELGVLGRAKGEVLPLFPKTTWTDLQALCARLQLKSMRNVHVATSPWKKSDSALLPQEPAYNSIWAGLVAPVS